MALSLENDWPRQVKTKEIINKERAKEKQNKKTEDINKKQNRVKDAETKKGKKKTVYEVDNDEKE